MPVRRLRCPSCDSTRAEGLDFVAPSARVTKRMTRYVAGICRMLSVAEVARHLGLDWKLVKACDKAVLAEEFGETDTSGLRLLAIDESSLKKGHRYITVVLDYETGRVVWMGEGRKAKTLRAFFDLLSAKARAAIEAVAIDMWAPYIRAVPPAQRPHRLGPLPGHRELPHEGPRQGPHRRVQEGRHRRRATLDQEEPLSRRLTD